MIASIIVPGRMPRNLGAFDYHVPSELEKKLRVGQLARVPFRSKERFGLVMSINNSNSSQDLKDISSLVHDEPLLLEETVSMIPRFASWYGVSSAMIADMFLPPLQKKKLSLMTLTAPFKKGISLAPTRRFHLYQNETAHHACLRHAIAGNTLILVPTKERLLLITEMLNDMAPVVWHSDLSTKEKFAQWFHVRNGQRNIIIATRSGVFLPFLNLDTVLVDYEHDENHKHWDSYPRYHTIDIAEELAKVYHANLHYMSFTPRVDSYRALFEHTMQICFTNKPLTKKDLLYAHAPFARPHIVDMRDERKKKNFSLFSDDAVQILVDNPGDTLVYINRLGYATSLECHDCGYVARCDTCQLPLVYHDDIQKLACHHCGTFMPTIVSCPSCSSPVIQFRGAGTELAEKEVRRITANQRDIVRIDSESDRPLFKKEKQYIIVGTDTAIPLVRWERLQAVIFVDFDKQLISPEYTATEHAWHRIMDVQYRRQSSSTFLIQTFRPDHLVFRSLTEPDRLYRTELSGRQQFCYPPYSYIVRYLLEEKEKQPLTNEQISRILTPLVATHPRYHHGRYWLTTFARLDSSHWQEELINLNKHIPLSWKIDPHPSSLLST